MRNIQEKIWSAGGNTGVGSEGKSERWQTWTDTKTCLLSPEMKRKVHFTLARILPPAHLNALFCHWPAHMLPSSIHYIPHFLVSFHPQ
jgi:hypothetical protein